MAKFLSLDSPVTEIKGIGEKSADLLLKLGIFDVSDLINHFPVRYQDRRVPATVTEMLDGKEYLTSGSLLRKTKKFSAGHKDIIECFFTSESGMFKAVFFNAPFTYKAFNIGEKYVLYGKVQVKNGERVLYNPEFCIEGSPNDRRGLIPVYRCTKGITSKELAKWIKAALDMLELPEWLPLEAVKEANICDPAYMYTNLHFPHDKHRYNIARFRYIYEELFVYQYVMTVSRIRREKDSNDSTVAVHSFVPFIDALPFRLTDDQIAAVKDIEEDLKSPVPMNRLLQGDVGCGKTAVAEVAMYQVVSAGHQVAFMVPTELLARQHYSNFKAVFGPFGIKCVILTSGLKAAERNEVLQNLASGDADIIIGTHALLQNDVEIPNLKLIITDEQHRFGVNQRKKFIDKGNNVNILVMSATPIPRTLAQVIFRDMDFSIIKSKPADRKQVITYTLTKNSRNIAYTAVKKELEKGHKAYVVAPSIESDDNIASVNVLYKEIKNNFKEYNVALLHGKIAKNEKEKTMQSFSEGKIDILVATVVIEVGIDVPEATIIVIESADRFGLSQLHQLRGRVGRSSHQSYCYLINNSGGEKAGERLDIMKRTNDGFELSEEDLKMRGAGDFAGTMQHGTYMNKILNLFSYENIAEISRADAERTAQGKISPPDQETFDARISRLYISDNSEVL